MLSLLTLLLVIVTSIFVTRLATVALTLTGLPREMARFQARSAFTGVGFTTSEAEKVVNHPVRRKILMMLMLLGNAGVVTAGSSLILAFIDTGTRSSLLQGVAVVTCFLLLWLLATSRRLDHMFSRVLGRFLRENTRLAQRDMAQLLHLAGDYGVSELALEERDWLAGRTLASSRLRDEGVIVLGINRPNGTFVGAPDGSTPLAAGDNLILYGRTRSLEALDTRARGERGDAEHREAVSEQVEEEERERALDPLMEPSAGHAVLTSQLSRWENEGGAIYAA